ncbi:phosphatidylinositol binding clathrin assembly [Echinococcus multilocularis]|uniref:Phosphatidylinositol binding clathrin assembly n=1 Tax=Echinococcus multilocularis TaxID=6211 RepID=A0A087W0A8_ECHMU|nr:phosphatidylinositol binding clathrin assembly [Echinococcus multilocularis]
MTAKMAGKMAKQLAGSGTGQSFMDRVTQAKYSLAGSALGKVVAKASTEELIAPKRKHLENLTRLSNEPSVSIPLLVNFLSERTREKSWVIVFKALITTHHLLNYGNEKISQYMASNNCRFNLPHFNDKSSSQCEYSKYLAEKTESYQKMAFDFCKVKRGKDDGVMRTMPADKLLKALPVLRDQLYVLFEFEATEKDLNNLIINAAFILLYKDLIRLFASYNEGMMNLVEKYFSMKPSHCKTAIELYRDFPNVMSRVDEFLTVAESLGIGDKESMGLHPVPPQILEAMEQHLALLKKKKKAGVILTTNGKYAKFPESRYPEDADIDDVEEVTVVAAKPNEPVAKPLSLASKLKASASPARPKSPTRPTSSPSSVKQAASTDPASTADSLLIADFVDTVVADETNAQAAVKVPPAEVVITGPDGECTEPVEDEEQTVLEEEREEEPEKEESVREEERGEDEDGGEGVGLSPEQQQAVIAAATSHFVQSADGTNQAVKHSVTLTPRQTRKSWNESGSSTRSTSPSRRRSPSPARPPPPHATSPTHLVSPHSGRSTPVHDDSEPEDTVSSKEGHVSDVKEASIKQSEPQVQHKNTSADVAIDDLLGFDDVAPTSQTSPPVQPMAAAPQPSHVPATQSKSHTALDDLLSLDPLMGNGSDFTVPVPTPAPKSDNTGLPPGLKPAPADVVIRPAVVEKEALKRKENPLDQLDTTLASLASSLGGSSSNWGSSSAKNK